jgi:hypothetical protein
MTENRLQWSHRFGVVPDWDELLPAYGPDATLFPDMRNTTMKQSLIIAATFVTCSLLSACGSGSDRGVEVRPPVAEGEKIEDPGAALRFDSQ